ncbi:UDP-glucose 4-epimerase GalE [Ruegeria conchae]|uniref:UDP-glucose 4-epimerase n=1 Tax=Ruegeria conchae TaxID=981384 RepID=A0A497ZK17_9RHOB|nr:UDP-glucose 4-epimerase GalE [Ruegeria conchae]RLK07343.1 UDP-galactose 4-epimerase [Ruegeria conchae]
MTKHILLTGGAGFIGSHTYAALVDAGYAVTILDNFENARHDVPDRLSQITGKAVPVIEADIRDQDAIKSAFATNDFDAVVHFAALKSVPDSEADPIGYYNSNCTGLINIVDAMQASGVKNIVFSSSAAVYGSASQMPLTETSPCLPDSCYGSTKLFGEEFLARVTKAHPDVKTGILRYFNPVGAHPSGLIGEDPSQPPGNLVPVIARVARGEIEALSIFGGDYDTPDGTCIRDYIHVLDLARGHVLSLDALLNQKESHLVNLGTGRGNSVREVLNTYSEVINREIPNRIVDRRPGDPPVSYAATDRASEVLGFEAKHGLRDMCESNWKFSGDK